MGEQFVPVLRAADAKVAARWYARLGFEVVGEHRFGPDYPLYLFLRRGELSLHLSEHLGDAPPGSLVRLYVEDLESVAEGFDVPVEEQPWGRELELTDPDGNRLRVAPAVRS